MALELTSRQLALRQIGERQSLGRLEEIHAPSEGPARWHRVIGHSDAELDEQVNELIASGVAWPSDGLCSASHCVAISEEIETAFFERRSDLPHIRARESDLTSSEPKLPERRR